MKKHLLYLSVGFSLILLFGFQHAMAQDMKSSRVHITITEDDKVTTDTTFELKEGHDPEMIKKVIAPLAGEDIHEMNMSHGGHKQMVWVHSGDDKILHAERCKEVHKDAMVLVIKNMDVDKEEGKELRIEVIVLGDEDMKWTEKEGENVDVYIIKKGDKDVIVKRKILVEIEEDLESEKKEKKK